MSDALKLIKRGSDEILTESDLKKKLDSGKKLIVKAGFDPTAVSYTHLRAHETREDGGCGGGL